MNVSGTTALTTTAAQAATKTASQKTTLDYDNFLKLLVAQMKNQDPTEPMKTAEYMGQLASFSQVEQSVNMNTKLDALLTSSALSQADGVIGRNVTSADGTVSGKVASVAITSEGATATLADGNKLALGAGITVA
ncbi:flagellar hook assembly protein FlgD [Methylobacterium sp. 1030]|uniref:flagellar hook assembly protein FlgD n=1 Tax=Methylobacterium sp. 1030 TaxID=3156404 RepID=UPI003394DAAF